MEKENTKHRKGFNMRTQNPNQNFPITLSEALNINEKKKKNGFGNNTALRKASLRSYLRVLTRIYYAHRLDTVE